MLKIPVLQFRWRKGDRIQKSGFFNFLCALFFSLVHSIYICDQFQPLNFFGDSIYLILAHSHELSLSIMIASIFYSWPIYFLLLVQSDGKYSFFSHEKKKISRFICLVILFKLPDRVGKSDTEMITDGLYSVGIEFSLILARTRIKL